VDGLRARTDALVHAADHATGSAEDHARYMRATVVPLMNDLRAIGDELEVVMPSDLWPLPTYREMLFVK
jgi:glutamine synthetase